MSAAAMAVLQGLPMPSEVRPDTSSTLPVEIVTGSSVPKKIAAIHFGMFPAKAMNKLGEVQIINRELYQTPVRLPMPYGPLDPKMGTSQKRSECSTCGESVDLCPGHFGWLQLQLPVFHIGYIKHIYHILKMVCKSCGRVLSKDEETRRQFFKLVRNKKLDSNKTRDTLKTIMKQCSTIVSCRFCGETNGDIKKIGPLRFIHRKFIRKQVATMRGDWQAEQFYEALRVNTELGPYINKAEDDMHPTRVHQLFSRITPEECELVGMHHRNARPEWMILQALLVPPCAIRPSVQMDQQGGSNEDDLTMKIAEISTMCNIIKADMNKGTRPDQIMDRWDYLQQQVAMFINSEYPGLNSAPGAKPIRGICQRLKGKQGRFRGNLSGKRVDFSSRTVISPDPNLLITEVGVPRDVAMVLTFPEPVFERNIDLMRKLVLNGPDVHPGARYIGTADGYKLLLTKSADRRKMAAELKIGDIVERHLMDGDVCLFNRQPSLHRVSIMAHKARVMHWKTFRFNECCCTPYNADFDGDEMNLHLPQTIEARAEAQELMAVGRNLAVPKSGELLISATQDFLTASWLITQKDRFFTQDEFCQLVAGCLGMNPGQRVDLPEPAILKPMRLYTGKQVFSVLIQPNNDALYPVNLEMKLKNYDAKMNMEYLDERDTYMIIRGGELLCGQLDKSALGGGKTTLFAYLLKQFDWQTAADRMSKVAQMCARFTGVFGFSIGISDVQPSKVLSQKKHSLITTGYKSCDKFIADYVMGNLDAEPGCTMEQTLESQLNKELSDIRENAGKLCIDELSTHMKHNSPLIMTLCGSKGSKINISQMVACVGQQTLSGQRIPNGFVNRTLPHFEINAKDPVAKGFVANSFYTGLTPTEFFFHTMGGREGLVDTAVKTAETGYMQRRLMKALEDLSVQYDNTVRGATGHVVQFTYGDDSIEPTLTEADEAPYDINRQWMHAQLSSNQHETVPGMTPTELEEALNFYLAKPEFQKWPEKPVADVKAYFNKIIQRLKDLRQKLKLDGPSKLSSKDKAAHQSYCNQLLRVTSTQLEIFFNSLLTKRQAAMVDPGTAVGALCGQSIGEPCTQMTLKTFHFAGVASMNITLGVPRIREIINATKKISTPIITVRLAAETDLELAKAVRGRIEKTTLSDVADYVKEVYSPNECCLKIKLDVERIEELFLNITAESVKDSLINAKKLKLKKEHVSVTGKRGDKIIVKPPENFISTRAKDAVKNSYFTIQALKVLLPKVVISGLDSINRCVIRKKKEKENGKEVEKYSLLVEGDDLLGVLTQKGVDATATTANHTLQVFKTLGIEAARRSIVEEIMYTMSSHGVGGDPRHLHLLADCMTYKGEVLGITRFGISKMKDSVLMLASFERTTDYLFDAGQRAVEEPITGVSECIIMGRPIPIGTGLFKVLAETPEGVVQRDPVKFARRPTFITSNKFADFSNFQSVPEAVLRAKAARQSSYAAAPTVE